jgi:hypothetical protein
MSYILQNTTKSHCDKCEGLLDLLCETSTNPYPWFYICWKCQKIWQPGIGPVKDERETINEQEK